MTLIPDDRVPQHADYKATLMAHADAMREAGVDGFMSLTFTSGGM